MLRERIKLQVSVSGLIAVCCGSEAPHYQGERRKGNFIINKGIAPTSPHPNELSCSCSLKLPCSYALFCSLEGSKKCSPFDFYWDLTHITHIRMARERVSRFYLSLMWQNAAGQVWFGLVVQRNRNKRTHIERRAGERNNVVNWCIHW